MLIYVDQCSSMMINVGHLWSVLDNVDQCWSMLTVLINVHLCWPVLISVDQCWSLVSNIGQCCLVLMLMSVDQGWPVWINGERCWPMLISVDQCWPILINVVQNSRIIENSLFKGFEVFGGCKSDEIETKSTEITAHGVKPAGSNENQWK